MAAEKELIYTEADGSLGFGDYTRNEKGKVNAFEANGDQYRLRTFYETTKLEKNEAFAYESEPGTTVTDYKETEEGVSFIVSGIGSTDIILAVPDVPRARVWMDGSEVAADTSLTGKISFRVSLPEGEQHQILVHY